MTCAVFLVPLFSALSPLFPFPYLVRRCGESESSWPNIYFLAEDVEEEHDGGKDINFGVASSLAHEA